MTTFTKGAYKDARLARPLVLAIDLDETFAASDPDARGELFSFLEAHADEIKLVYMSHGSAERLIEMAAKAELPVPQVFMADGGTTVLKGDGTGTIEPLQRNIIQLWPGKQQVEKALSAIAGVELLEDQAPCRQHLKVADGEVSEELQAKIDELGCHLIGRGDGKFDVLPFGVDKGTTLGRYLVESNIDPNSVLSFGEDVGDELLFGRGWSGAVMGHAPEFVREIGGRFHNVVVLEEDGAPAVLEALRQHGWIEVDR